MTQKTFVGAIATLGIIGLAVTPALAYGFDDVVKVNNSNSAYVKNDVSASASTGGNDAKGGNGGGAAQGGDVKWSGNGNEGGSGGDGGNGGDGGYVGTGDAVTAVSISNKVNTNKTKVNACGCDGEGSEDTLVKVKNYNHAKVKNYVDAKAKTGHNDANGGDANGGAGEGGDVKGSNDSNDGGDGGNAGDGGMGGGIETGGAASLVDIVNKINTNVTRVRR